MPSLKAVALLALAASAFTGMVCASPIDKRITHEGRVTWFDVGLGACGETSVDSQDIVAISHLRYGDGGNCNQWMKIMDTASGKFTYALTLDKCMSCEEDDIDLSPHTFQHFADLGVGVMHLNWHFMEKGFQPPA